MQNHWLMLLGACALEALAGYPPWLYARIGHPVTWMGKGIEVLERNFNNLQHPARLRRAGGVAAMALLVGMTFGVAWAISTIPVLELVGLAALLAQRSLYEHVREV